MEPFRRRVTDSTQVLSLCFTYSLVHSCLFYHVPLCQVTPLFRVNPEERIANDYGRNSIEIIYRYGHVSMHFSVLFWSRHTLAFKMNKSSTERDMIPWPGYNLEGHCQDIEDKGHP